MARLISRADLARRCGVSKAAITKACATKLAAGCVADRIDVDHESVRAYMASKGITLGGSAGAPTKNAKAAKKPPAPPTKSAKPAPNRRRKPTADRPADAGFVGAEGSNDDLEHLAAVIGPLLERFGTETRFKDWLFALKEIETIREKRLKNEETEGALISRELVKTHVFGAIEAGNRRLLGDSPKTLARRLYALAKSGADVEVAEQTVREIIGSQLKPVKATAVRVLKNA